VVHPINGMPEHVACIMDGNGRWASTRGLSRTAGHAAGETALHATVDAAIEMGIRWLTVFAFSTENWLRPLTEVQFLMRLNTSLIRRHGPRYHERNVRIRYLGRPDDRIPGALTRAMTEIQERTARNDGLTFTIAFNYGGRAELVHVLQSILDAGTHPADVTERHIAEHLPYPDMPDPDLVVRTAGEQRISNFMLWRAAYSELVFTDVLWPDFGGEQLREAVDVYRSRRRRFGTA
jgi:undecaprenyl diphosphate synthase